MSTPFDYADLDGHLLQLLVAVVDVGSITGAAQRLGVTQSAVSHLLDKLRAITGDALFVKSGRGIVATAHAEQLAIKARELLAAMEGFARSGAFEPSRWRCTFTIAANDFQRDVLLPPLMAHLRQHAPDVSLRVIASNIPSLEMLRQENCQLVISPRPPEGGDVMQKRLFEDKYRVYYDPVQRQAPQTQADYLAAEHVTVVYEPQRALDLDQWLTGRGVQRKFRVMVPGMAALPAFLRGSQMLTTAPGLLRQHLFKDLGCAPVPIPCPKMPMYMVWHRRYQDDSAHRWMREALSQIALNATSQTTAIPAQP
jgi:DNA-binding transcriptional LysR family regulator